MVSSRSCSSRLFIELLSTFYLEKRTSIGRHYFWYSPFYFWKYYVGFKAVKKDLSCRVHSSALLFNARSCNCLLLQRVGSRIISKVPKGCNGTLNYISFHNCKCNSHDGFWLNLFCDVSYFSSVILFANTKLDRSTLI